jgi:nicotinate-nucleotide adenylyltransferase
MRTAFFGGSFDPPHCGHLAIAQAAANRFALDQVLFAPAGNQPLKGSLATASYADRLAMVRIATQADPRFSPCELDCPRPDHRPNYTYDTLSQLKLSGAPFSTEGAPFSTEGAPSSTRGCAVGSHANHLFCLLGADSFHTLRHWHRAAELLLLCDFIVAARPGYTLAQIDHQLPAGISVTAQNGPAELQLAGPTGASTLHLLLDLEEDISATALRQALGTDDTAAVQRMLPPGIADYIHTHTLYPDPS